LLSLLIFAFSECLFLWIKLVSSFFDYRKEKQEAKKADSTGGQRARHVCTGSAKRGQIRLISLNGFDFSGYLSL
jgi:hypothetical protein